MHKVSDRNKLYVKGENATRAACDPADADDWHNNVPTTRIEAELLVREYGRGLSGSRDGHIACARRPCGVVADRRKKYHISVKQ